MPATVAKRVKVPKSTSNIISVELFESDMVSMAEGATRRRGSTGCLGDWMSAGGQRAVLPWATGLR